MYTFSKCPEGEREPEHLRTAPVTSTHNQRAWPTAGFCYRFCLPRNSEKGDSTMLGIREVFLEEVRTEVCSEGKLKDSLPSDLLI